MIDHATDNPYKVQKNFGTLFSFKLRQNQNETCTYLFIMNHYKISMPCVGGEDSGLSFPQGLFNNEGLTMTSVHLKERKFYGREFLASIIIIYFIALE
jgi:hypothetical protein